jgi:hypothetical protein
MLPRLRRTLKLLQVFGEGVAIDSAGPLSTVTFDRPIAFDSWRQR